MIVDFHDVLFSPYISHGARVITRYNTKVIRMREGHEERYGEWQDALREFDITPALRHQADLDDVVAFFQARGGPRYAFKIQDPLDYQATLELIGTGNASKTQFQAVKRYTSGLTGDTHYTIRPIVLLDDPILVYLNDVAQVSGYTVNYGTGVITFTSALGNGVTVKWSGTFTVPVRFSQSRMATSVEVYQNFTWRATLMEVRAPVDSGVLAEIQSDDFMEVEFPTDYSETSVFGPTFDVIGVDADSGQVKRIPQSTEGSSQFSIEHHIRTLTQAQTVLNFFHARRGRLIGFRAKDITDFTATNEFFGTGNNILTVFQLIKVYTSGGFTQTKIITKPISGTILLYADDSLINSGDYTIDYTTGLVTFDIAPGDTVELTWTGEFDLPVRFDTDELDISVDGFEVYNVGSFGLTEIKIDLPNVVIAASGPSPLIIPTGCSIAALPDVDAVTKYLNFPGNSGPSNSFLSTTIAQALAAFKGIANVTIACVLSHEIATEPGGNFFHMAQEGAGPEPGAVIEISPLGHITTIMGSGAASFGGSFSVFTGWGCLVIPFLGEHMQVSAPTLQPSNDMKIYCVTFDWATSSSYVSGSSFGFNNTPNTLTYNKCVKDPTGINPPVIFDGASVVNYVGRNGGGAVLNGQDVSVSGYPLGYGGGVVLGNGFRARVYELLLIFNYAPVPPVTIISKVHKPIINYFAGMYGTGFTRISRLAVPGSFVGWYRADTNVTTTSPLVRGWDSINGGPFNFTGDTFCAISQESVSVLPNLDVDGLRLAKASRDLLV